MADGEDANGSREALEFHLRSCAACRAKLRAYRAIPDTVFELMPAGPLLDQSMGGHPHEWIAERAGAIVDKVREAGYSLLSRGGGSGDAASVTAAGGTRGAGMAAVAKVLAICGATAAGGATCVATGVVDPGAITDGDRGNEKPAIERPAEPASTATVPQEGAVQTEPDQAPAPPKEAEPSSSPPTPVQQKSRQFGVESPPASSSLGQFQQWASSAGRRAAVAGLEVAVGAVLVRVASGSSEERGGELWAPGP